MDASNDTNPSLGRLMEKRRVVGGNSQSLCGVTSHYIMKQKEALQSDGNLNAERLRTR
jgi:hypothetical protein